MQNFYSNSVLDADYPLDTLLFHVKIQGDVVVPYLENSLHVLKISINKEVSILFSSFFEENVLSFDSVFILITHVSPIRSYQLLFHILLILLEVL